MPSILTENPLPTPTEQATNDPATAVQNVINQILGSSNPQAVFQQVLNAIPNGQQLYAEMNKYGNGNPQTAFMNYASQMSKQSLAQQIKQNFLSKFGLG